MRAGWRSKTVAFVAILALTTFGALVLGANVGPTAAVVAHQTAGGKADKRTGTPRTGAVANLKGIEPAPSLAHKAFEVAQWASQSSAAAAIQRRFAPEIVRRRKNDAALRSVLAGHRSVIDIARGEVVAPEPDFNAADAALALAKPLTAEEVQNLLGVNEAQYPI